MTAPVAPGPAGRVDDLRGFITDMDGVVTDTAALHERAWKRLFDAYLQERRGDDAEPFTSADYDRYVDGRPRYDGAAAFLESRDIELPRGTPDDPPDRETVCGLGNRKNRHFRELVEDEGVTVLEDAVRWLRATARRGYPLAVVTSSRNGRRVLEAADLTDLFDARVDGLDGEERGLPGKPAPDYFLAAARELGVEPDVTGIAEDSRAGVEAGRRGGFGLVIGVTGGADGSGLRAAGADIVVDSLGELPLPPPVQAERP